VFLAILQRVDKTTALKTVVLDFEPALWRSVRHVVGEAVDHKGCIFHWTQAVWHKVQDVGLASAYRERDAVHRYVRRLMTLPFLPADDIVPTFEQIKQRAQSSRLLKLVSYLLYTTYCISIYLQIQYLSHTRFKCDTFDYIHSTPFC